MRTKYLRMGVSDVLHRVLCASYMCICVIGDFALSFFPVRRLCSLGKATEHQLRLFLSGTVITHMTRFLRKQDFAGPYIVVPRESQDRSVVIVLLTSCSSCNLFHVLLVLGHSLVLSHLMTCALHCKDFTLMNMIIHSMSDARMITILSHSI